MQPYNCMDVIIYWQFLSLIKKILPKKGSKPAFYNMQVPMYC